MRLFFAIELDDAARAAVVAEQRRLTTALGTVAAAVRMVRPRQLHLTLVFLGDVTDERAQAIEQALAPPIERPSYTVELGGLGTFPSQGAPRVLWLGLLKGAPDTCAVHTVVVGRLGRVGVAVEQRAFTPHLTLGRWRDARPHHRRLLESPARTIAAVRVDAVTLFHSRLSDDGGAVHTPLMRTALQCH